MRKLLAAACLASALAWAGPPPDPNAWTPDADTAAKVDAMAMQFDLPAEFGKIDTYARYYGGTALGGRRVIIGVLITPRLRKGEGSTVHAVSGNDIPFYADGGCMFVNLIYDVETGKITHIQCNFDLRPPPPKT